MSIIIAILTAFIVILGLEIFQRYMYKNEFIGYLSDLIEYQSKSEEGFNTEFKDFTVKVNQFVTMKDIDPKVLSLAYKDFSKAFDHYQSGNKEYTNILLDKVVKSLLKNKEINSDLNLSNNSSENSYIISYSSLDKEVIDLYESIESIYEKFEEVGEIRSLYNSAKDLLIYYQKMNPFQKTSFKSEIIYQLTLIENLILDISEEKGLEGNNDYFLNQLNINKRYLSNFK